jgi:iron(III) transport system ATP-binding protein
LKGASLSFGDHSVLRDIHLRIEPGEFFALLGPSGCGKSTLLRLIAGFNPARPGTLLIDGEDVSDMAPWQRKVGMVFQSYALWPHMTVAQNVACGLEERRLGRPLIDAKVREVLDLVGLGDLARRRPSQLSGGQQQRVAIARALVHEPRLLICDEPTSALDSATGHQIMDILSGVARAPGRCVIIVTHDPRTYRYADRITEMEDGRVTRVLDGAALGEFVSMTH